MNSSRRGVLLIIVASIAAILIATSTAYLAWMRTDAGQTRHAIAEAQARVMLHAGLMYLQESSLLGWTPAGGPAWLASGWTDVRDGSLGPRGPRPVVPVNTPGAPLTIAVPQLPEPTWWKPAWPAYRPYPNDNQLPSVNSRSWPCPGSVLRVGMGVWERPPYALIPRHAANPVDPLLASDPAVDWTLNALDPSHAAYVFAPGTGAYGMRDPQAESDTWSAFVAGDRVPRAGSDTRGWFRIYRELLSDHDGDQQVHPGANPATAPVAWSHDSVAYHHPAQNADPNSRHRNWNVFIVSVGSGATQGHRFWDRSDGSANRAIEQQTAEELGQFGNESIWRQLRSEERVLHFRVEWTAATGGLADMNLWHRADGTVKNDVRLIPAFGGGFLWIQRLDREPVNW
jgi:hypothetical protein